MKIVSLVESQSFIIIVRNHQKKLSYFDFVKGHVRSSKTPLMTKQYMFLVFMWFSFLFYLNHTT